MRKTLDLNDIRIFIAAAQTGSMSAAGRSLELPTSTISRGIARLEKYMELQLVDRERTGVVLTDAGLDYLRCCLEAVDVLSEGQRGLLHANSVPEGLLRVACPALMAREVFAPLVHQFVALYPGVRLEVLPYHPGDGTFPAQPADLNFTLLRPSNPRTLIRQYPATRRAIYSTASYLQKSQKCEVPEDLLQLDCIGSRAAPHLSAWHFQGQGRSILIEPVFKLFAAEPTLLRAMVRNGLGVTLLPVWLALETSPDEALVHVLPDWEPVPVPLYASVPFGSSMLPATVALLDFFDRRLGTDSDPRLRNVPEGAATRCFARHVDLGATRL